VTKIVDRDSFHYLLPRAARRPVRDPRPGFGVDEEREHLGQPAHALAGRTSNMTELAHRERLVQGDAAGLLVA